MSSRRSLRAQREAALVLWETLELPRLRGVSARSALEHRSVAGVPTTVVRPARGHPSPTVLFVNGATPHGSAHPGVLRLSRALASVGYRVLIPDLPGIAAGELSPETLASTVAIATAAADEPGTTDQRVALAGVSVGASVALLAAADPALATRISTVACIAPYADLAQVARVATTGTYADGGALAPHAAPPALLVGLARSLVAQLPESDHQRRLYRALCALDPAVREPLATLPLRLFADIGADAVALAAILANRDPARFDLLYSHLPIGLRQVIARLSPLHVAGAIAAPVEIASAPRDRYFPITESAALVGAIPRARLTVTSLLSHAEPVVSARHLAEIVRLDAFFVRALTSARSRADLPDRARGRHGAGSRGHRGPTLAAPDDEAERSRIAKAP